MIGRQAELSRIREVLDGARAGRGGALLISGEAGIGKTTLLAAARAEAEGMGVLSAGGVEAEAQMPFAGLGDLLGPLTGLLGAVPAPQAAALGSALAISGPVPGDRFAICAGFLGVLRAAGEAGPLAVFVDDLHWLDRESVEPVLFAARRLEGTGVALLVATRPGEHGQDLPGLELPPLDAVSAQSLLAGSAPGLSPAVSDAVLEAAAGNPLALLELPGLLRLDPGESRLGREEPLQPGPGIDRAVGARLRTLSSDGLLALLVAAAAGAESLATVATACGTVGVDAAALEEAEREGLVRLAPDRVEFGHPLYRGAIYHRASPTDRRAVHRALAAALTGERRAWHLAAAAIGPDSEAADALEQAAGAAASRRGYAAAAAALERSAALSADPGTRDRRLLAAAGAAVGAGRVADARRSLDQVAESGDTMLAAEARQLLAVLLMLEGDIPEAARRLELEANLMAGANPVRAATLLADASMAAMMAGDCFAALARSERAAALLGDGGDEMARAHVGAALGWSLALRGETDRARIVLRRVEALLPFVDPLSPAAVSITIALNSRLPFEEFDRALAEAQAMTAAAREAGAVAALPSVLVVVADAAYRLGDWETASAAVDEAWRLAAETGQRILLGQASVIRARLNAACGREAETLDDLAVAQEIIDGAGILSGLVYALAARGFLELGLCRPEAAAATLDELALLLVRTGLEEPSMIPWVPDLVEACLRLGRVEDAERHTEQLARRAERAGSVGAMATAVRCRGLVADGDYAARFEEALILHAQVPLPFEVARTQLAYGERLHRERRRAEARKHLRIALGTFQRLGARPWVERTEASLKAAGAVQRAPAHGPDELSHQERRVAAAVAAGAMNREVAAELFLSPKTVEFHLGNIYRKLGIRSRSQLVALVAAGDGDLAPPPDA